MAALQSKEYSPRNSNFRTLHITHISKKILASIIVIEAVANRKEIGQEAKYEKYNIVLFQQKESRKEKRTSLEEARMLHFS